MAYLYPIYRKYKGGGGGGGDGCLPIILLGIGLVVGFLFCIVCVINGWVLVYCQ